MPLVFPKSVGGGDDVVRSETPIEPIEERVSRLTLPESVGGSGAIKAGATTPFIPGDPGIRPFPEEREETRAVKGEEREGQQDLPPLRELGSGTLLKGEDVSKIAALTPVLMATTNNSELADILVDSFDSLGKSFDPGGNELLTNNKTGARVIVNAPGLSKLDLLQGLGITAAFLPGGAAATAAGALLKGAGVGAGKALAGTVGVGAVTSGLTQAGIEGAQEATGGEFDTSEVALSAALGGAGELVAPAIQTFRQGRQASQLGVEREAIGEVLENVARSNVVEEATGVGFLPAQRTLDPFAIQEQSFVASLPAASRKATKELTLQNKQVSDMVNKFLADIAPSSALQRGNISARDAAKQSVEAVKNVRKQVSNPFYKEAFKGASRDKLVVDTRPAIEALNKALAKTKAPSAEHGQLKKFKQMIENSTEVGRSTSFAGEATRAKGTNLPALHRTKALLFEAIEKQGDTALGATIKRDLAQTFGPLKEAMEAASPSYKDAQRIFQQASGPVDDIVTSNIGQISKITDQKINNVSDTIFNLRTTDPEVIRLTREAIETVDPEAWAGVVRVEAQKRLSKLDLEHAKITPDNAPAKMATALFGSGRKRDMFLGSLTPEMRVNAEFVEEALVRAGQGRPGGSQTGVRSVIEAKLKGAGLAIRRFLKNPVERLISTGEESAFNRNTKALGESIFDPKWQPRLTEIRELDPNSPEAGRAMAQLLKEIKTSVKVSPQTLRTSQEQEQ